MNAADPALAAESMTELLQVRAAHTPDARAFLFLLDGVEEGLWLTYGDLDRRARAIGTVLRDAAGPGDRVLLLFAPGLEFLAGFFGCLYAGVVPVPAYPPRPDRLVPSWEALGALAADCEPRVILTDAAVARFVPSGGAAPALAGLRHIVTDTLESVPSQWRPMRTNPDDLAILQYTSGSTAAPKGVMVTHRNLMHNEAMIFAAFEHHRYVGVGVNWLPPYHDMGLIGGLLQTVYRGAACVLLSPIALLQDPLRWLRAISRYRADTSGGPNFAYDLCVQRSTPEERAALDLSNWSVAAIGSEPVSPRTMDTFAEAFAPASFHREAFYPCYGLAEATLIVTGGLRTAAPVVRPASDGSGQAIVGCGRSWLDQEVRVVDPDTKLPCVEGTVGEIWVRGPSVARGYWNKPDETAETFQARLADGGEGPYLRTGDLGFLECGELFVTGRIKDVIVIRGRNHYPQDIEATVQSAHAALRPGCGAAFEIVHDGEAKLVVVQEVDRRGRRADATAIRGDIRQAVAEQHQLQVFDVVLLEPGSIPKTSSGKVRRSSCKAGYETGGLRAWERRPE